MLVFKYFHTVVGYDSNKSLNILLLFFVVMKMRPMKEDATKVQRYRVYRDSDGKFAIYCPTCYEFAMIKSGGTLGEKPDAVFFYCYCSFQDGGNEKCAIFDPDYFSSRLEEIIKSWKKTAPTERTEERLKPKDGYEVILEYHHRAPSKKVKEPNPLVCMHPPL